MTAENQKWITENHETVIGQLVLYHSPVDLAYLVLRPELWNDAAVEKIRRTLEKSEGLLEIEKQARKKVVAKKPKKIVKETNEEANSRFIEEKIENAKTPFEERVKQKILDDELPD